MPSKRPLTPTRSGETGLWRIDGDRAHAQLLPSQPDAADRLRLELPQQQHPLALVLRGGQAPGQVFETRDHRGTPVLALALPVAGEPWWLVTQIGLREALIEMGRAELIGNGNARRVYRLG